MKTNEAIMAFSLSEKINAGIIWVSETLNLLEGLPGGEKVGGERMINALLNMIGQEIRLAKSVAGNHRWEEIEPYIDKALVMVNSGVGEEATPHLSMALSKITNIAHQSMTFLKEKGLL
ncbi:MAG: hypothetical protein JSW15_10110 [Deltaproteobacteria bacterium]|nr:MAG: hypothetical protein JSW15_10110 [Deltaproteobacteria bacterium]